MKLLCPYSAQELVDIIFTQICATYVYICFEFRGKRTSDIGVVPCSCYKKNKLLQLMQPCQDLWILRDSHANRVFLDTYAYA